MDKKNLECIVILFLYGYMFIKFISHADTIKTKIIQTVEKFRFEYSCVNEEWSMCIYYDENTKQIYLWWIKFNYVYYSYSNTFYKHTTYYSRWIFHANSYLKLKVVVIRYIQSFAEQQLFIFITFRLQVRGYS